MTATFTWPREGDYWAALARFIAENCDPTGLPVLVSAVFTVRATGSMWSMESPSVELLIARLLGAFNAAGICCPEQVQVMKVTKVAPVAKPVPPGVWLSIAEMGVA
jgi:hypothetical protein